MSGRGRCSSRLPFDRVSTFSVWLSSGFLLAFRCPPFFLSLELLREPVKAGLPQAAVLRDPCVELAERFRSKRVQALRPLGADFDEPRLVQDPEVSGDAGLLDVHGVDDVVHRHLAISKDLDDPTARGIGQGLKDALSHDNDIHTCVYECMCISY